MPLFGFAKKRLNPDFPLAHRFLIGLGVVIGTHSLAVVVPQVPMDRSPMRAGRTVSFQRTPITDVCICSIDPDIHHMPGVVVGQPLPLWAGVAVLLGIIGKLMHSQQRIALPWLG